MDMPILLSRVYYHSIYLNKKRANLKMYSQMLHFQIFFILTGLFIQPVR